MKSTSSKRTAKTDTDLPNGSDSLKQSTDQGTAPSARVTTAKQVYSIYTRLKNDHERISYARARIQGQLDGNSPVAQAELRRYGLDGEPNVNYRETEGIIDKRAGTLWRMLMDVPTLITLTPNFYDPHDEASAWADIIAEQITFIYRTEWKQFPWHVMLSSQEMLRFGVGPNVWPDEHDYRWESLPTSAVLCASDAPSQPGGATEVCIRRQLDLNKIFDIIEQPTQAAAMGWNVKALKEFVMKTYRDAVGKDKYAKVSDFESIQKAIRNYQVTPMMPEFDKPRIVDFLCVETSAAHRGAVSHYIIAEAYESKEFLLEKRGQYKSMDRAVALLFYGIGDGCYKSVKGLGHKLFPFGELSNNFMNRAVSGAITSAGLIVQPKSEIPAKKIKFTQHGPLRVLDPQVDAIQASFQPPLDKVLAVRNILMQVANNNYGVYRIGQEPIAPANRTAREAMIQHQNESVFDTNEAAWFYYLWSALLGESVRRLLNPSYPASAENYNDRKTLVQRCEERGVPRELLDYTKWTVEVTKAVGLGSAVLHLEYTEQMMSQLGVFDDEKSRDIIKHAFIVPRLGLTFANRLVRRASLQKGMSSEESRARMEGLWMKQGEYVPTGVDDMHPYHIKQHGQDATQLAEAFQAGQVDPMMASNALALHLKHLGEHVTIIAPNPTRKALVRGTVQLMQKLGQVLDEMERVAQKMAEAQAQRQAEAQASQQPPQDPDMAVKMHKADNDMRVRMYRETELARIREASQAHKNEMRRIATMAKIGEREQDQE